MSHDSICRRLRLSVVLSLEFSLFFLVRKSRGFRFGWYWWCWYGVVVEVVEISLVLLLCLAIVGFYVLVYFFSFVLSDFLSSNSSSVELTTGSDVRLGLLLSANRYYSKIWLSIDSSNQEILEWSLYQAISYIVSLPYRCQRCSKSLKAYCPTRYSGQGCGVYYSREDTPLSCGNVPSSTWHIDGSPSG